MTEPDPVLPGRFRIGAAAASIVSRTTEAAGEMLRARGTDPGAVRVDPRHAAVAFRSERYLKLDPADLAEPVLSVPNGNVDSGDLRPPSLQGCAETATGRGRGASPVGASPVGAAAVGAAGFVAEMLAKIASGAVQDPLTGDYRAKDGWVRLHCNYPHHAAAVATALGTAVDRDEVVAAVARRGAIEVEEAVVAAGGAAAAQRGRDEWLAHPQGVALRKLPLVLVERIGDAPPVRPSTADRPLAGMRVVELTHVIAGPVAGRTLAAHGADVVHVGARHLPVVAPLLLDTQFGKRSTYLDLRDDEDAGKLRELVRDADVFVQSYRPDSLAARGFGPADLAALRPGIVVVDISAWGWAGPWRTRRGFDSLAQMATGIAAGDPPLPLPLQFLDHGTGWLAAAAAIEALTRRITEGGSWRVRVSLARTGMWLDEMGRTETAGTEPEVDDLLAETDTSFGRITHIRIPGELPGSPPYWDRGPGIPGADPPEWR
ncbi:CoA transferase [Actinocrispum wychmicini]|uniref:CoA transferase family III n=1 Tax=Actinocrispum wychmicini TaxID=1213861 RepID=A0A4R2J2H5_9PSEU|nr:CoA transferase [Actinocrispum wychmicini]TCO52463.1 CoA transferase family III [Actinocrispum wychmicini]